MALIFEGSTDRLSANHTSRFVEPFLRWLFHGALSAQGIDEIHFLIRKAGHLSEYAVLCSLFWWALRPQTNARATENASIPALPRPGWRRSAGAVVLAACFAASDEFHQSFVPTRGASVEDVLIDTGGAVLGLMILLIAGHAIQAIKRQRIK